MENMDLDQVDRRRSIRLDLEQEEVELSWTDMEGQEHKVKATCIDISRRGMLIEYEKNVQIGTKVQLKFTAKKSEGKDYATKVARCHRKNFSSYHLFLMLS